jgi:hypothetical protein
MTDHKAVFLEPKEGGSDPMGAMSQPASHHLFVDSSGSIVQWTCSTEAICDAARDAA